jgi:hypothetical protein
MKTTYLAITLQIPDANRAEAAKVYTTYRQPFLDRINGALSKELLVGHEDVVVLHGFDSVASAEKYLHSDLFTKDVVSGLTPWLTASPAIRIYSVL